MRAVLSVYDKSGLAEFARELRNLEVDIFCTGKTYQTLREADVVVHAVSDLTGGAEILDGRVKTLHPALYAGLVADRGNPQHMAALEAQGFAPIDLLVVNLYPFVRTVSDHPVALADA